MENYIDYDKLKSELSGRGITQQEIAEELSMTQGNVSHMLNGHVSMSANCFFWLVDKYNLQLDKIIIEKS